MKSAWCRRVAGLIVLFSSTLASSCVSKKVNDILADPSRYRDQEVELAGSVVDSYAIANRGAYRIEDNTGRLWVISEKGVPRKGARVTVRGTVREGFNLGSLGGFLKLPDEIASGVVLIEASHRADSP